jgi:hypothetical protein
MRVFRPPVRRRRCVPQGRMLSNRRIRPKREVRHPPSVSQRCSFDLDVLCNRHDAYHLPGVSPTPPNSHFILIFSDRLQQLVACAPLREARCTTAASKQSSGEICTRRTGSSTDCTGGFPRPSLHDRLAAGVELNQANICLLKLWLLAASVDGRNQRHRRTTPARERPSRPTHTTETEPCSSAFCGPISGTHVGDTTEIAVCQPIVTYAVLIVFGLAKAAGAGGRSIRQPFKCAQLSASTH